MNCKPVKKSTIFMWLFSIIMVIGMVMILFNLNCKYIFSKYDGIIFTIIGFFASMITAVKTNEPVMSIYGVG